MRSGDRDAAPIPGETRWRPWPCALQRADAGRNERAMYHRACRSLYTRGRSGATASPRRNAGGRWRPIVSRSSHGAWRGNGDRLTAACEETRPAVGRTRSSAERRPVVARSARGTAAEAHGRGGTSGRARRAGPQSPLEVLRAHLGDRDHDRRLDDEYRGGTHYELAGLPLECVARRRILDFRTRRGGPPVLAERATGSRSEGAIVRTR